jgi:hypothetical protein
MFFPQSCVAARAYTLDAPGSLDPAQIHNSSSLTPLAFRVLLTMALWTVLCSPECKHRSSLCPAKARWKLPLICCPRSDRAKGFYPRRKGPGSERNPAPKYTQSQKDICSKGLSQRKTSFIYLFSIYFSRQNVCSRSGRRSAGSLPSDLPVPSLIAPHLASGTHKSSPRPSWAAALCICAARA